MKRSLFICAVATVLMMTSCKRENNNYNNGYNLSFWTSGDCSPNPISVTVDSQTVQITKYFPNGVTTCGVSGCANFNLPAGTYTFSATNGDTTWQGTVTVTKNNCTLQQLPCSSYTGSVTFWTPDNAGPRFITVTMDSLSHAISTPFTNGTPSCGTHGCANFSVGPGIYAYTATNGDTSWQGNVTVTKGACVTQELAFSTGNVTFWVDSAVSNGLSVAVDSSSAYISTYFPNSTPSCGASGCANFTLHVGTYSYTATSNSGPSYAGMVVVTNNGCTLQKVY